MYIIIADKKEKFKPITYPNVSEGYLVSNYGNVYDTKRQVFLSSHIDSKGYVRVTLRRKDKRWSTFKVHRLVAWEFCKGRTKKRNQVNHKDSIRSHNYYENLEWVTSKENSVHAFTDGLRVAKKGTAHYANKYSEELIRTIKIMLKEGYSTADIMHHFGYKYSKDNLQLAGLISDIKKNHVWKHIVV